MRLLIRSILDKILTTLATLTAVGFFILLVLILGPMAIKGLTAVVFYGTVEFRRMQVELFGRGSKEALTKELSSAYVVRQKVYDLIDQFKQESNIDDPKKELDQIYRAFRHESKEKRLSGQDYTELSALVRDLRDKLQQAIESNDKNQLDHIADHVLSIEQDGRLEGTAAERIFHLARRLKQASSMTDLQKASLYRQQLADVENIVAQLFGPRPGGQLPALFSQRYGVTRWDQAKAIMHRFLYIEQWVQTEPGKPLVKTQVPRRLQFAGTSLEGLFDYLPAQVHHMLRPKLTVYWQFFIDDSIESHSFGGIGPELLGTLSITVLTMLFVIPLGVISAAYLAEQPTDSKLMIPIRLGINTLAGVPSIVFGLFGLAFFVLSFQPAVGLPSRPCILAASLTLTVLALPVMIRASEEAIRAVPTSYKEAALALGAGRLRTFLTVTLPAAMPGILTGVILCLSRVAGETAPVLFTGAVAMGPLPRSILDPTRTLSYGIYDMAVGDRIAMMFPHNQHGLVMTLVVLIVLLNGISIRLRTAASKALKG